MVRKLSTPGGYGFQVVDLFLYALGVALCQSLVTLGCDISLACDLGQLFGHVLE